MRAATGLFMMFFTGFGSAFGQLPDCSAMSGWTQEGTERFFEPDNLFDYMNGNAEGYLLYQFLQMKGITCKCGEDTIVIDISEMSDPEYAYGIFSSNRDMRSDVQAIGMGGQILPRRATFAKDKYYVELAANPDKDHTPALRTYVGLIEKAIDGRTTPPAQIGWFPKEGLVPDSVRLVPESVLGIRLLKRGYVGQYDFGKGFLVEETDAAAAKQVMTKLRERLTEVVAATIGEEGFRENDRYLDGMVVFRKGRYIVGFANVKGGTDTTALAAGFAEQVQP
jgi:hypothetical protein